MRPSLDADRIRTLLRHTPVREVVTYAQLPSTNAAAAARGEPWVAVFADHQTAGRGRLGRTWAETPGAGLAMSILLPAPSRPGWVPLLTGLALRDAVRDVTGFTAALKWPNDLLDPGDGRKLAGILCEFTGPGVVVGVGLNVDHAPGELPVATATSLTQAGVMDADREAMAAAVLVHLARLHTHLLESDTNGAPAAEDRAAYRGACTTIGALIDLHEHGGRVVRVTADGVDEEGRLVVRGPSGRATVSAGDVHHIRLAAEEDGRGAAQAT